MTRIERLAQREARAKEKLEADRKEHEHIQSAIRAEHTKARNKRRYTVGAMADEAGLLAWRDTDLAAAFAILGRLGDGDNQETVLETLLAEGIGMTLLPQAPVTSAPPSGGLPHSLQERNGNFVPRG